MQTMELCLWKWLCIVSKKEMHTSTRKPQSNRSSVCECIPGGNISVYYRHTVQYPHPRLETRLGFFLFFLSVGLSAFFHVGIKVDLSDLNSIWFLQPSTAYTHDVIKISDLNISHTDWTFVLLNWKMVQVGFLNIILPLPKTKSWSARLHYKLAN